MKRNDRLEVTIEGLDARGHGVAGAAELPVHVAGATAGDRLRVRVDAVSRARREAWAHIEDVVERGPDFRRPPCHHAAPLRGACGGCALMHASLDAQLVAKAAAVAGALGDLAPDPIVVHASDVQLGYRNRTNLLAWRASSGAVHLGSRAPRSNALAKMDGCPVLATPLAEVIAEITALARATTFPIWPEPGGLRWVSSRTNGAGAVLVELVVGDRDAPWLPSFAEAVGAIGPVAGVLASTNAGPGSAVRTEAPSPCVGESTIPLSVGDLSFSVSTHTFAQLNAAVATRMLGRAVELSAGARVVWDLYAGLGALGVATARATGAMLYGAESEPSAVEAAAAAARRAGLTATFAETDLAAGPPPEWPRPGVVLVNPPRRGLDDAVLERLVATAAPVVYMSCDPSTFARDARALGVHGFVVSHIEAHDMLPQTRHVELLARIEPPLPPTATPS